MLTAGSREEGMRVRSQLLTVLTVVVTSFIGCVELTPPWERAKAQGGTSGGAGLDGPDGQGGASDVDAEGALDGAGGFAETGGGEIDVPQSGRGDVLDAQLSGTGGAGGSDGARVDAGAGGSGIDGPVPDRPLASSGGTTSAGGTLASGGAGGTRASGGASGSGGAPGTGGSTVRDAAPDLRRDTLGVEAGALRSGLIIYYPCDGAQADGITLPDLSGRGNHGTLHSGIPDGGATSASGYGFQTGVVGSSVLLTASAYGWINMPPQAFVGLSDLTISVWVKLTTSITWEKLLDVGVDAHLATVATTGMVYMCMAPTTSGKTFAIATNGIRQEQDLGAGASSVIEPSQGWTHLAVVLAPTSQVLYINGVAVVTRTNVSLRPKDLGTIDYAFIGRSQFTSDTTFDGAVDEFRVYDRALAPEEIEALYQLR